MASGWTKAVKDQFLEHLARSGNVTAAAFAVGRARSSAYKIRDREPGFARSWAEAEALAVEALAAEARRRAVDGVEQPIVRAGKLVLNQDGSVATIRAYSDRLLEFLLRTRTESSSARQEDVDGMPGPVPVPLSDEDRLERVVELLDAGRARAGKTTRRRKGATKQSRSAKGGA